MRYQPATKLISLLSCFSFLSLMTSSQVLSAERTLPDFPAFYPISPALKHESNWLGYMLFSDTAPSLTLIENTNPHTYIGYVNSQDFRDWFGPQAQSGYLRLFDEYKIEQKKKCSDSFNRFPQGIIQVIPKEKISESSLVIGKFFIDTFRNISNVFLDSQNPLQLKFIPVQEKTRRANHIHFKLCVKRIDNKEEPLVLYEKVLFAEFRKHFSSLYFSPSMNRQFTFVFPKELLKDVPEIEEIYMIPIAPHDWAGVIGEFTNLKIQETEGDISIQSYSLEKYPENFKYLILKKKEPTLSLPSMESMNFRTSRPDPYAHLLSENWTSSCTTTPEPSAQIKSLNLDFQKLKVGGLKEQMNQIAAAIRPRGMDPHHLEKIGFEEYEKGIILYGPPGTGKTTIAREIAKQIGVDEDHFRVVSGPELLNSYVGKSEQNLRDLFVMPEQYPQELFVIFFDEFDALARERSSEGGAGGKVAGNMVNQLLSLMDGIKKMNNVLIMAATNRLDMIDPALLRPGRIGVKLYIGLADHVGRQEIFQIHLQKNIENATLAADVDITKLADSTQNYTGAEIMGICKKAREIALERAAPDLSNLEKVDTSKLMLEMWHFRKAIQETPPSFGQNVSSYSDKLPRCGLSILSQEELVQTIVNRLKAVRPGKPFSCLLHGEENTGKSAIAGLICRETEKHFDLTRVISPSLTNHHFCTQLEKVWEETQTVNRSLIILDALDTLIGLLNMHRYDARALEKLNLFLGTTMPRTVVVIATMSSTAKELFQEINPTRQWSLTQKPLPLSNKDIKELLELNNIKSKVLPNQLLHFPIGTIFDILNGTNLQTLSESQWQERLLQFT